MAAGQEHKTRFRHWNCCVLVPTYNNAASLPDLLQELMFYCDDLLVVDDGSTDETPDVLGAFPDIDLLRFSENQGKGKALQAGFRRARERGFSYAITMDADGQHAAADLPGFLDELAREPGALIVGARNMDREEVPGGSSFGNRFSNFWYWVETGIKLPDTQSGYRLYPLLPLEKLRFFTSKYEFEIEVLVKAAWNGIPVRSVPVNVHYAPEGERVSHFRPFWDFLRISLLNSYLVLVALLYQRHRMMIRKWRGKNWRELFREYLLSPEESFRKRSFSVGFGVFMGIVPIWGYQFASALFLAHLMRLNKMLVGLAAQISIPPMIPFILYGSFLMGDLVLPGEGPSFEELSALTLESIGKGLYQYLIGSLLLAVLAAVCSGFLSYGLLILWRSRKPSKT